MITSNIDLQTRARINSLVLCISLLTLSALLAWISTRYTIEVDWTRNGRHTLSAASIQVLNKIEGVIEITAYAREQKDLHDAINRFINRYKRIYPDIVLHYVNPDAVPNEVRNLGVRVDGELVVRYQGRSEHVRTGSEQEFTNALQRLLRGSERWLAFSEGHAERNPLGNSNHDVRTWAVQLSNRGFNYQPINLSETPTIPDNTSVFVLAGPLVPLFSGEVQLILDYLDSGGNMLWLGDPGDMQGLEPVAEYLGLEFSPGTIIDYFAGQLIGINDPTIALVTASLYGPHPTVEGFSLTTFFPAATTISSSTNSEWSSQPILTTGDHTWLEMGKLEGDVKYDQDSDRRGPLTIALGLQREIIQEINTEQVSKQQRIIVVGDGDFLSNTYVGNSGNLELGIRLMNWLSGDDDFISIPARAAPDLQLDLTPITAGIIGFTFLLILPLMLAAMGGFIWWRRKNL